MSFQNQEMLQRAFFQILIWIIKAFMLVKLIASPFLWTSLLYSYVIICVHLEPLPTTKVQRVYFLCVVPPFANFSNMPFVTSPHNLLLSWWRWRQQWSPLFTVDDRQIATYRLLKPSTSLVDDWRTFFVENQWLAGATAWDATLNRAMIQERFCHPASIRTR